MFQSSMLLARPEEEITEDLVRMQGSAGYPHFCSQIALESGQDQHR